MIWWQTIFWWRLSVSIARWAGCLCPYETQRARSPCPSEGLNWVPQGCRASAPHPQTLGAQSSTPVKSLRTSHQSHLTKSDKKIKMMSWKLKYQQWAVRLWGIWMSYWAFSQYQELSVCVFFSMYIGNAQFMLSISHFLTQRHLER